MSNWNRGSSNRRIKNRRGRDWKEAKQPIAVPDEQEDGCTIEQQVDHAEWVVCLCLCLCLYLYYAVGGEEVLPAAVPNEEEDDDTEEQVEEQEKDRHCSHSENQHEN